MARTPFKLKSGNGTSGSSFKKMGSSPVRTEGHGGEEGHGHLESGKVDPRTLSNRFSEFNKAQIKKGHPQKIVTTDDSGNRVWHWENKPDEKHHLGNPTTGESKALLTENIKRSKEMGIGESVNTAKDIDIETTKKAKQVLWQDETKGMSKKELLEKSGKQSNWLSRLLTTKKGAETEAIIGDFKASKGGIVGIPASKESAEIYQKSLIDPKAQKLEEGYAKQRTEINPDIKYHGQPTEEVPTLRKASGFKMPGYGKRKK